MHYIFREMGPIINLKGVKHDFKTYLESLLKIKRGEGVGSIERFFISLSLLRIRKMFKKVKIVCKSD